MSVTVTRGTANEPLGQVISALERFQADHPLAVIDAYLYGRYAIRVRVVDPVFDGLTMGERHRLVWKYFDAVPEETLSDLSTLLTLAPGETTRSAANRDFDDPLPPIL